jgi:hypothetical protein
MNPTANWLGANFELLPVKNIALILAWLSTLGTRTSGTHLVYVNVHISGVVIVKHSPPVVTVVGTAGHEVVNTTTVRLVISGVHVRIVTHGVRIVKVWE